MKVDHVVVDGNNIAYRSDCVMDLSTVSGQRTSAIFGMLISLRGYLLKFKPAKSMVVCWDSRCNWRRELYPDYKGHRARSRTPEEESKYRDFILQLNMLRNMTKLLGVDQLKMDNYEADDLICDCVYRWSEAGDSSVVVSSDKDLAQLVDKKVKYYIIGKKPKILTLKNFKSEFGVDIEDWVLFRAMVGDSSDNINGIPGVAEKTAMKIIARNKGNVDAILKDDKVKTYVSLIRRNLSIMALSPILSVVTVVESGELSLEPFRKECFTLGFNKILQDFPNWVRPFVEFNAWRKGR